MRLFGRDSMILATFAAAAAVAKVTPALATEFGDRAICKQAFESATHRAHGAYLEFLRRGLRAGHLTAEDLNDAIRSIEKNSILNPYDRTRFSGQFDGFRRGLDRLIHSKDLQAHRLVTELRALQTEFSIHAQQAEDVRIETRSLLTLELDQSWGYSNVLVIKTPDDRTVFYPPQAEFKKRDAHSYDVLDAEKRPVLHEPGFFYEKVVFSSNGDELWFKYAKDADFSNGVLRIKNMTHRDRDHNVVPAHGFTFISFTTSKTPDGITYASLIEEDQVRQKKNLVVFAMENPKKVFRTAISYEQIVTRDFGVTRLSSDKTVFLFSLRDKTSKSQQSYTWNLKSRTVTPWPFEPLSYTPFHFLHGSKVAKAASYNNEGQVQILNLETFENELVDKRPEGYSLHDFYHEETASYAIFKRSLGESKAEILMVNLTDMALSHSTQIEGFVLNPNTFFHLRIFKDLQGRRIGAFSTNQDARLTLSYLDTPRTTAYVARLLSPIPQLFGYVRSGQEERLVNFNLLAEPKKIETYRFRISPSQSEVKP